MSGTEFRRWPAPAHLKVLRARRAQVGDLLIICTYAPMTDEQIAHYQPTVVLLDEKNRVKEVRQFR